MDREGAEPGRAAGTEDAAPLVESPDLSGTRQSAPKPLAGRANTSRTIGSKTSIGSVS